jgi:hypothetical protein
MIFVYPYSDYVKKHTQCQISVLQGSVKQQTVKDNTDRQF